MKINKTFLFLLILFTTFIIWIFYLYGEGAWKIWNIPAVQPSFIDARIITAGAESHRLGYEPELDNPQDPYRRLFNLPAVWKLLFLTGIKQEHTAVLANVFIAAFLVGLVAFSSRLNRFSSYLLAFSALSPPVFLAFERGNVELFIFLICSLSVVLTERTKSLSVLLLWLAGILKVFPIFGLFTFLHMEKKTFIQYSKYFILAFSVYALITFGNFRSIFSNTQVGFDLSYGLGVFPYFVGTTTGDYVPFLVVSLLSVALSLLIVVSSIYLWMRTDKLLIGKDLYYLSVFRLGAGIYIGTFFLGNNWDYRLIFLLFTLPQLADWMLKNIAAKYTLAAILVSLSYLWLAKFLPFAYFLDEIANWMVFTGLFYLFVVSSPDWLRQDLQNFFGKLKPKSA
jgi:hypothetical protein